MRWRRSPAEIRFRLAQEIWNFKAFLRPPNPAAIPDSFTRLFPSAEASIAFLTAVPAYRERVLHTARQVVSGRIPILGTSVSFSPSQNDPADWRRDLINGPGSEAIYFRRLPYLDAARTGDHKVIWELNRHQHVVLLAQAACLDPAEPEWISGIAQQLDSWFEANPFHRGINWTSALEVAFRALSWIWILHLVGNRLPDALRRRISLGLFQHASHLAHNLSVYFAPNTHLLGEAVCLHALGCMFPHLPEAPHWRTLGTRWVQRSLDTQVLPDGAYFEQSSWYHLYAVDFFLFHAAIHDVSAGYRARLRRMCVLQDALTDLDGSFPLIGDDDGGRLFYPFGERRFFPRATLTAASFFFGEPGWRFRPEDYAEAGLWLFGPCSLEDFAGPDSRDSRHTGAFPESGLVSAGDSRRHIVFTARAFGVGSAGHSHAHALHFILRCDQRDLLIDAGTFTYVGDQSLRNRFRETSAHNTVRLNSMDQSTPANAFRWAPGRWDGRLASSHTEPGRLTLAATVRHPDGTFRITRTLTWSSGNPLVCEDLAEGPPGEHFIEQFWHVPADTSWNPATGILQWQSGANLQAASGTEAAFEVSEYSGALYHRAPARTLHLSLRSHLPVTLRTEIWC